VAVVLGPDVVGGGDGQAGRDSGGDLRTHEGALLGEALLVVGGDLGVADQAMFGVNSGEARRERERLDLGAESFEVHGGLLQVGADLGVAWSKK